MASSHDGTCSRNLLQELVPSYVPTSMTSSRNLSSPRRRSFSEECSTSYTNLGEGKSTEHILFNQYTREMLKTPSRRACFLHFSSVFKCPECFIIVQNMAWAYSFALWYRMWRKTIKHTFSMFYTLAQGAIYIKILFNLQQFTTYSRYLLAWQSCFSLA